MGNRDSNADSPDREMMSPREAELRAAKARLEAKAARLEAEALELEVQLERARNDDAEKAAPAAQATPPSPRKASNGRASLPQPPPPANRKLPENRTAATNGRGCSEKSAAPARRPPNKSAAAISRQTPAVDEPADVSAAPTQNRKKRPPRPTPLAPKQSKRAPTPAPAKLADENTADNEPHADDKPPAGERRAGFADVLSKTPSWLVSTVAHLVVLVTLALLSISVDDAPRPSMLIVESVEQEAEVELPQFEPAERPVRANEENLRRLEYWLPTVELELKTNPYDAMTAAIEMLPDAIFLLSDGNFTDRGRTERWLEENNFMVDPVDGKLPKVVVNTIAFYSQSGEPTLKKIAEDYGGTYRFVPKPVKKKKKKRQK